MISNIYELLEPLMLVCFGSSWPFSIAKILRTKSVKGKSIVFLLLVFVGYVFGIMYKLMIQPGGVVWLYVLNSLMIATEIVLYIKYKVIKGPITYPQGQEGLCPLTCL